MNTPDRKPLEGRVVTHTGVTRGCLPKHSEDRDVRAAIDALGTLRKAELTDHIDIGEDGLDPSIWGAVVEPRGQGRVALYWVERGSTRERNGKPFKVELDICADQLRKAGWTIEPRPDTAPCVFAWHPVGIPAPQPYTELVTNTAQAQPSTAPTVTSTVAALLHQAAGLVDGWNEERAQLLADMGLGSDQRPEDSSRLDDAIRPYEKDAFALLAELVNAIR